MSYTAQQVFDIAVGDLIGKRQANGVIDPAKVDKWKARTTGILTAWQNEMSILLNVDTPDAIESLSDEITIDSRTTAHFYLAAQLLLVEDPASSSYFNTKFEENRNIRVRKQPAEEIEVTDAYDSTNLEDTW